MSSKLKVYAGAEHPHGAQKPQCWLSKPSKQFKERFQTWQIFNTTERGAERVQQRASTYVRAVGTSRSTARPLTTTSRTKR